ncbi:MAG TPA: hypothetical protein VJ692_08285 [Nitrospiraceae bacterium]|nr:hypothetical protein [Nitrospiraceae bacterium]
MGATILLAGASQAHPQTVPSVTGIVQQYLQTPHGEVNGVLLSDGTVVRFPPHLGIAVASTVKSGDPVNVVGFPGPRTPHGRSIKALTMTNTATGRTVVDQPPTSKPLPPAQGGFSRKTMTISGTIRHILVNSHGDPDGAILSGGEQIAFKPHQRARVLKKLQRVGKAVTVTGPGTTTPFGTVIELESLTIDGETVHLKN